MIGKTKRLKVKPNSRSFCPQCGSEDVVLDGALVEASIGSKLCKSCGYRNINFPERTRLRRKRKT